MDSNTKNWRCIYCGCSDNRACPEGCMWVREKVCSSCEEFDNWIRTGPLKDNKFGKPTMKALKIAFDAGRGVDR